MPRVNGVLETAVYVEDIARSTEFYKSLLDWQVMESDSRFCAFNVSDRQVFLLFKRGSTRDPTPLPGGVIPPHEGGGHLHTAFAVTPSGLDAWEKWLGKKGVAIESRVQWPSGGRSLYFRDPDGHLLELVSPGTWAIY